MKSYFSKSLIRATSSRAPLLERSVLDCVKSSGLKLSDAAIVVDTLLAIAFAWALTEALIGGSMSVERARPWLLAIVSTAVLRGTIGYVSLRSAAREARSIKSDLRRRVLYAVLGARAGSIGLIGESATAAVDEIEALDGYLVRYAPARANATMGPILVLLAAGSASPIAAGLLVATLVPFIALMILAGGGAASASRRQLESLSKLSGLFADRVRALPLILAFQAEARVTKQIASAAQGVSESTMAVLRIAFISSAGLEFFAALSVALIAVYAGFGLLGLLPFRVPETLTFEHSFFVLALAPEFYAPMRRLAAAYHEKQLGEAAAERLEALLRAPRAPTPSPAPVTCAPRIRYRGVSAGFSDDATIGVGPVDFEIPAGGIVALMGATGSGKTTLLRLLIGDALLTCGEIEVGDQRLSEVGSFAPVIAWAGQGPVLLPGSIADNIALGLPAAMRPKIDAVAIQAGLAEALASRPRGLDTPVDERGSGLSGGERRRIGLARAILKPSYLLLLDEPTADLDKGAETALIEVIRRAASGRTVLIATHSEELAAIADRIVRL